jgi:hypothetical protein
MPPHVLGEDLVHLQVQSIDPMNAPLSILETGYRSHFIAASAVAYVDVWVTAESEMPVWRERERTSEVTVYQSRVNPSLSIAP